MKITGKDLIAMGYRQGRWFKSALKEANAQRLVGDELKSYLDKVAPQIIDPHAEPVSYHLNIRAESEEEEANVESVKNTMVSLMKTPTIVNGAVMPDACPTGSRGQIPVGGVVVAKDAIHPSMHSADVCCSVMMTSFGHIDPKKVLDHAHRITHFGGGGREDLFDFPTELEDKIKSNYYLKSKRSLTLAKTHLTHHGSRGFGANLYKQGMQAAEKFRKEISPSTMKGNAWIPYSHPQGKEYWEALQIVREWCI